MSIHGGGSVQMDILEAEYEDSKKDRLDNHEDRMKARMVRQQNNIKQLMSEKWGREVLWDFIVDAGSLKLNPYTRNADTYYILGLQRQAKLCIEVLKQIDLTLYHKMEQEAHNREKREEEIDG
jgi:hypothetical protein